MIARKLDVEVAQRRLRALRELLDRLEELGDLDGGRLRGDWRTKMIVERLLTQVVDYAVQLNTHLIASTGARPPDDYRSSFLRAAELGVIDGELAAQLAPSAGLRNVLIHQYLDVDVDKVAAGARRAGTHYGEYVQQVAAFLRDAETGPGS